MNFVRGIEPLRAMKIGIITWDKLSEGVKLLPKMTVPLSHLSIAPGKPIAENDHKFTSDGSKQVDHLDRIIFIKDVVYKRRGIIQITYYPNERCMRDNIVYHLTGSLERFRKYFNIVQER